MYLSIFDILCIRFSQDGHIAENIYKHVTHNPSGSGREKGLPDEYPHSLMFSGVLSILVWVPTEAGSETRI